MKRIMQTSTRRRVRQLSTMLFVWACGILFSPGVFADDWEITQVDSSSLLTAGSIRVYLRSQNQSGETPAQNGAQGAEDSESRGAAPSVRDFRVRDRDAGPLEVLSAESGVLREEGISFLMLLDNSGSMYDEQFNGRRRIDEAVDAIRDFTGLTAASGDRMGMALFDTGLTPVALPGDRHRDILRTLETLRRPERQDAYTELYNALLDSADDMADLTGRRAIILLSDGRNLPYLLSEAEPNPTWGERLPLAGDVSRALLQAGVTLYAVNFSDDEDPGLAQIASASGGAVYRARSGSELARVYENIRNDILNELRLEILAPAIDRSDRQLIIGYDGGEIRADYYIPRIFAPGRGEEPTAWPLIILFLAIAAGGTAILFLFPFEGPAKAAQLRQVDSRLTAVLRNDVTSIGSDPAAGLTLAGNPAVEAEHATVVRDDRGTYRLESGKIVMVNNQPVTKTRLRPGDVIRIEGTTLIFDEPESRPPRKTKSGKSE